MGISNILHQFPEASEIHWKNDHTICCPTLYVALQMVLKMLLVFIMLVQIPGKVLIMGKSKIICHIMHHFAKPAPVNALLAFFGIIVNKSFHLEENPSPFYLQENIEYPGTANSYAYMSGKARYKDHDEEKAKLLEEKYSSREKKIDFHVLSVQIVQEIKGIIRLLKVMLEKENGNWDKVKEQNDEDKAGAGFTGRKIKAYDKLELTDEQQKVLATLRQNCVEETLWSAIAAFQNYPFRTSSGLPYQYKLKIGKDGTYNKELLIDRRENSKTLSWSSIKMAFQNCRQISGIVKRPKALGDIRGISYIYPLFWKFGLIEVPEETAKKMCGECDTEAEL